jgi:hypothetical protein
MTIQSWSWTPTMRSLAPRALRGASITLALVVVAPSTALADSVTLVSDRDNTLYEDVNGALSNGAGSSFFAGVTASGLIRRGLLHFDVAGSIPAGSTVTGVTLTLVLTRAANPGPYATDLHRVLADWGEGTSVAGGGGGGGAPSTTGDATWIHTFYDTDFWTAAGGDFDPAVSASTMVSDLLGPYVWTSATMVSDVQAWLDAPAGNFGWLVEADESTSSTALRFSTREDSGSGGANRPMLTVDYDPPAGSTIFVDGFESGDYCQWSAVGGVPPCPVAFGLR